MRIGARRHQTKSCVTSDTGTRMLSHLSALFYSLSYMTRAEEALFILQIPVPRDDVQENILKRRLADRIIRDAKSLFVVLQQVKYSLEAIVRLRVLGSLHFCFLCGRLIRRSLDRNRESQLAATHSTRSIMRCSTLERTDKPVSHNCHLFCRSVDASSKCQVHMVQAVTMLLHQVSCPAHSE